MNDYEQRLASMSCGNRGEVLLDICAAVLKAADDPYDPYTEVNGGDLVQEILRVLNEWNIYPLAKGDE